MCVSCIVFLRHIRFLRVCVWVNGAESSGMIVLYFNQEFLLSVQ